MNKFLNVMILTLFLAGAISTATAGATAQPSALTVVEDMSASAPLSSETTVAEAVGETVANLILNDLLIGDWVVLREFGDRSNEVTVAPDRIRLDYRNRQQRVAPVVQRIIGNLPSSPRAGQGATNIIWTLATTDFNCSGERSIVVIASDGIEASADIESIDAVLNGSAPLPTATSRSLEGCRVLWLTFGLRANGHRPLTTVQLQNLQNAWRQHLIELGADPEEIRFRSSL